MKARGWGVPGLVRLSTQNVDVDLGGVCACGWRKKYCVGRKRCQHLAMDGGEAGEIHLLHKLMGKNFPKVWGERLLWKNGKQYDARSARLDQYRREYFKKCVPLSVEVVRRKG